MFSNNIGLVRIYCPCRFCTFVIHVSSFFAQRPKARKPSATLADLKTHGARRVDRRGFHLLGRDGRKQISTSYDTYIYIYIPGIYLLYRWYAYCQWGKYHVTYCCIRTPFKKFGMGMWSCIPPTWKQQDPSTRLQICPLYIFGNNPPQMVPMDLL